MARLLLVQLRPWQQLGVMYLAANARKHGHEVRLAIGSTFDEIRSRLDAFHPDVVGFSVMTIEQSQALKMASAVKACSSAKTLFGGPHVTYFPDFINNPAVDAIIRGEGESACVEYLEHIDGRRPLSSVRNLWAKSDKGVIKNALVAFDDINAIEPPDRSIYEQDRRKIDFSALYMLTSRGCPYSCSFCFNQNLRAMYKGLGPYVRLRNPDSVIDEIRHCLDTSRGITSVHFVDDLFAMERRWREAFFPKYTKTIGLPFFCLVRADMVAANPEYAMQLKQAGCNGVAFGVESGSESFRDAILKKHISNDEIVRAAESLHSAGLKFKAYNIFGLPGESVRDAWETVELNIRIKTDFPHSSLFIPFPMLELTDAAERQGSVSSVQIADGISADAIVNSRLQSPNIHTFEKLNRLFQTAVLMPRLWPLIRKYATLETRSRVVRWLENAWFGVVFFYVYYRSTNVSLPKLIGYAVRNVGKILGFGRSS